MSCAVPARIETSGTRSRVERSSFCRFSSTDVISVSTWQQSLVVDHHLELADGVPEVQRLLADPGDQIEHPIGIADIAELRAHDGELVGLGLDTKRELDRGQTQIGKAVDGPVDVVEAHQ
jgi:hypothetical protein